MALLCWRCGKNLDNVVRRNERNPIERQAQCRNCHADLHVCKMCQFYNPRVSEKCDHDSAEAARDFELANFCQYYKPSPHAFSGKAPKQDDAMNKLKALFGEDAPSETSNETGVVSPEEQAHQKLQALFKKPDE